MNKLVLPIVSSVIFLFVLLQLNPAVFQTHAQSSTSATFGVVGDMGGSNNASSVLTTVKNANLNFFLHVGDFSYDQQGGPSGWPGWVKGIVGTVLPYEIVSGNHDDCCISSYVAGLPNKMANLNGTYGQNYYFDYPQTSPLMRVIMISPGGFAPDTTWLTNAIDTARSTNIPWVVVGMHRNCITTGQKSCEIGQSLFNLLLSKKVDLILQGHDHNYQRSKQLTCATANTFVASCVANAGPNFVKGAGSVIVLDGAGGNGFYGVSSSDSEAGYFAKINSDTYGYSQFTVTATQISEQFVRAAGGSLSDSFTIAGSTITNPSVTPTTPPSQVTPTGVVPTFGCVSQVPCTPSATPTLPPNVTPTTNPNISNAPSVQPTVDPCANGGASVQDNEVAERHHKKHSHSRSGGNGAFSQLIQMLLEWLKQLFAQLGIPWPDNLNFPGVTPVPTQEPGGATPTTNPIQPTTGPTTNPCPSTTSPPTSYTPTSSVLTSSAPTTQISPTSATLQTLHCLASPHVCGFPDDTNTGWKPTGVTLKTVPAQVTSGTGWTWDSANTMIRVTQNGAVLDGLDIVGSVDVLANNVTIKRSRIVSGDYYPIRYFDNNNTGLLLEDTEIAGTNYNVTSSIAFANYTARRVNIHGGADGFKADSNVDIEDSYVHDLSIGPDTHNDGLQSTGGTNVTFKHSTCIIPNGSNACFQLGNESGPISNVLVTNSLLDGGGWTINMGPQGTSRVFTNNHFGRSAAYGPVSSSGPYTWTNNIWDDTGAQIP